MAIADGHLMVGKWVAGIGGQLDVLYAISPSPYDRIPKPPGCHIDSPSDLKHGLILDDCTSIIEIVSSVVVVSLCLICPPVVWRSASQDLMAENEQPLWSFRMQSYLTDAVWLFSKLGISSSGIRGQGQDRMSVGVPPLLLPRDFLAGIV